MIASYRSLITLCAGLLVVHALHTAQGATLYGLTRQVQLISIDPQTFNVTNIGNPIVGSLLGQNHASIDAKNGIYYFRGLKHNNNDTLIGLSLKDGTVVKNVDLLFLDMEGYCNVDTTSGDVFVTGYLDNDGPMYVTRIDMKTNLPANVGIIEYKSMRDLSAFDSQAKVLYLEVLQVLGPEDEQDWLSATNVETGAVSYKIKVDHPYRPWTLNYDPVTDKMYGIGFNSSIGTDNYLSLLSLDQKTGKITRISLIPKYELVFGAALDVKARRLSALMSTSIYAQFDLVTIDINTGKVVYTTRACKDYYDCPWSIEYGL